MDLQQVVVLPVLLWVYGRQVVQAHGVPVVLVLQVQRAAAAAAAIMAAAADAGAAAVAARHMLMEQWPQVYCIHVAVTQPAADG